MTIMQFFAHAHLSARLQRIAAPVADLAEWVLTELPDNAEKAAGLRKLLEAKDCFVRAALFAAEPKAGGVSPAGSQPAGERTEVAPSAALLLSAGGEVPPIDIAD